MLGHDRSGPSCGAYTRSSHACTRQSAGIQPAVDPAVEELNRIVKQAEALLRSLGDETGEAADAVRDRVTETLQQAKARLATTAPRPKKWP